MFNALWQPSETTHAMAAAKNRGGSLLFLGLDRVRDDRAAIGVRRVRPGADIRCDRQREMTPRIGHLQLIVSLIGGVLILIT